jgi:hypothetical protein
MKPSRRKHPRPVQAAGGGLREPAGRKAAGGNPNESRAAAGALTAYPGGGPESDPAALSRAAGTRNRPETASGEGRPQPAAIPRGGRS